MNIKELKASIEDLPDDAVIDIIIDGKAFHLLEVKAISDWNVISFFCEEDEKD